jgi:hypothetical protein
VAFFVTPSAQADGTRAAAEWVAWEDAVISMESSGSPGAYSSRRGDARLAFVRICSHYFAHGGFLDDGVLLREAGKLAGIPGIMIHGRNDLGGPVLTAWELARAWPGSELVVVEGSGHTGSTAMEHAFDAAADRISTAISEPAPHRRPPHPPVSIAGELVACQERCRRGRCHRAATLSMISRRP